MEIDKLFGEACDENKRVCSTCGRTLPLNKFYKDGKTRDGKQRYRRDCKDCYNNTRAKMALYKEKEKKRKCNQTKTD